VHFMVRFEPRPGKESESREELLRVISATRSEPGCLSIYAFESVREPLFFALHSEWAGEAEFESHGGFAHTVQFLKAAVDLLTHPVQGMRLRCIGGGAGTATPVRSEPVE
jgi:quinol monooxygenase YgiN